MELPLLPGQLWFGDLFVSQNLREFRAFHPLRWILVCAYTISLCIEISFSCTVPRGSPFLSSPVLSCTFLLDSLIMWLIASSPLPHNLFLIFYYVLSIFTLPWLIFIELFSGAMNRDSVSLLKFPFLYKFQVFSCQISSVCLLTYPYSCFSSHFYFLVIIVLLIFMLSMLFLVIVIILSLLFYVIFESYRCYLQHWWVRFLLLFLIHRICLCHLSDVRSCASS